MFEDITELKSKIFHAELYITGQLYCRDFENSKRDRLCLLVVQLQSGLMILSGLILSWELTGRDTRSLFVKLFVG